MGGLAMRAPVLAAMFLIVTLATLAMPGSANFIGEFFILNGVFQAKIVYAVVAMRRASRWPPSTRCASTSARCTTACRTASTRARSRCARRSCSAPLVACIVALALYPGLILERGEADRSSRRSSVRRRRWRSEMTFTAPDIDYAGLSPIIALTAGLVRRAAGGGLQPPPSAGRLGADARHPRHRRRALHLAVGRARGPRRRRAAARRPRPRDLADRARRGRVRASRCPRASRRPSEAGVTASSRRCCSARCSGWSCSRRRRT